MGGFDFAANYRFLTPAPHEKADAVITNNNQVIGYDDKSRDYGSVWPNDCRIRFQTELGYKDWGITAGYSWGLFDRGGVSSPSLGTTPNSQRVYSRFLNVGIFYRIPKKRHH